MGRGGTHPYLTEAIDFPGPVLYTNPMQTISRLKVLLLAALLVNANIWAADAPKTFKVGEFDFARPASWEWVEATSSMRKAQLKVSGADKKQSAEVIFFYFGEGSGGGTQANVDRWLGQFQEPKDKINSKVEEVKVGKLKVTYVQAEGTYMSGMPAGPKTAQPGSMLMGAILESAQGNVFVRMTGPVELVKASKTDFRKMIEGAKAE
jgi:hypothetical protein